MKKANKASAFVGSHIIRSRKAIQTMANDPTLRRKIIQELERVQSGRALTRAGRKLIMEYASQEITGMIANKIGGVISGDRASIPPEFIGAGDPSDGLNLLTTFTTSGPGLPSSKGNGGVEAINVKSYKYKTYINKEASGKFKENPFGYEIRKKLIFDSERDCIQPQDRLDLITESGFNQSIVEFFDRLSAFTFEDIAFITDYENKVETYRKKKDREKTRATSKLIGAKKDENDGIEARASLQKALAIQQLSEGGNDRLYSKVLKFKTTFKINSDTECYLTYVKISLCKNRQTLNCDGKTGALTATDLYNGILANIEDDTTSSIKKKNLIKKEKVNKKVSKHFKKTLLTEPGTDIWQSEVLLDNIDVVRTYKFVLRPSERGIIEISQFLPRGIDLFNLSRSSITEAPCGLFMIAEISGDPRARISDAKNPQIKFNGNSPIQIRYEMKREITFISSDRDKDTPATLVTEGPNLHFDDGSLAEIFYPDRRPKVSVDINKINIGNRNPDAKYVLDMDITSLNNPTRLERAQEITNLNYVDWDDTDNLERILNETSKNLFDNITEKHKNFYSSMFGNKNEEDDRTQETTESEDDNIEEL